MSRLLLVALLLLAGCADRKRVTLYSGGQEIQSWVSDGFVMTSGGVFFFTSEGKRVAVSGDVKAEVIE